MNVNLIIGIYDLYSIIIIFYNSLKTFKKKKAKLTIFQFNIHFVRKFAQKTTLNLIFIQKPTSQIHHKKKTTTKKNHGFNF